MYDMLLLLIENSPSIDTDVKPSASAELPDPPSSCQGKDTPAKRKRLSGLKENEVTVKHLLDQANYEKPEDMLTWSAKNPCDNCAAQMTPLQVRKNIDFLTAAQLKVQQEKEDAERKIANLDVKIHSWAMEKVKLAPKVAAAKAAYEQFLKEQNQVIIDITEAEEERKVQKERSVQAVRDEKGTFHAISLNEN